VLELLRHRRADETNSARVIAAVVKKSALKKLHRNDSSESTRGGDASWKPKNAAQNVTAIPMKRSVAWKTRVEVRSTLICELSLIARW
jgi:hypothetical protein